jgi:hypothetical protein
MPTTRNRGRLNRCRLQAMKLELPRGLASQKADAKLVALVIRNPAVALCAAAVFLSALLLFLIQPIIAKALLPRFGGSAGVWTACMFFFQAVLLLGYAYAHFLTQHLQPSAQRIGHVVLLFCGGLTLPVTLSRPWVSVESFPILHIVAMLVSSIGLPYFALSATSPLMQTWVAPGVRQALPYRLFALSNTASLLALLAYPLLIEPWFTLTTQLIAWSVAYIAFAFLAALAAWRVRPLVTNQAAPAPSAISTSERLLWIALAAVPCALWLAVASQISHSIAPAPLIWIIPLGTYLLTLMLAFHGEQWYRPAGFRWLLPVGLLAIAAASKQNAWSRTAAPGLVLFIGGLLISCLFCHGELARRKPSADRLTSFYLMVALGGLLGSVFVGVFSPLVFHSYLELPLSMAACLMLALALLYGLSARQLLRPGLLALAALILSASFSGDVRRLRNFYGVLEVRTEGRGENAVCALYNGTILHGSQFLSVGRSREATTYYAPESGVGREILAIKHPGRRIGIIGLGVGTLAVYAKPGDLFRFYEINPLVIELAKTDFRFLRDCRGAVEIVPGDARLALERERAQHFDLLVVDAFGGDAVPVHLLTQEAFELYLRHLAPEGAMAVHITSKYTDLAPVVYRIAASLGRNAQTVASQPDLARSVMASTWILLRGERPAQNNVRVWRDDYSNPIQILKF